jgi:hypothetical protein
MRTWKVIVLLFVLLVTGVVVYNGFIVPAAWYSTTRIKSISVLKAAESTNQLTDAVGPLGLFLSLTNGSWLAIRYTDTHSGAAVIFWPWAIVCSSAVARDSGGGWLESDRHFCGSLKYWPRRKDSVEGMLEAQQEHPELFTNRFSPADSESPNLPKYAEMMALETAPDLAAAREALKQIGFKPLDPKLVEPKQ